MEAVFALFGMAVICFLWSFASREHPDKWYGRMLCLRCGHRWTARKRNGNGPSSCPSCRHKNIHRVTKNNPTPLATPSVAPTTSLATSAVSVRNPATSVSSKSVQRISDNEYFSVRHSGDGPSGYRIPPPPASLAAVNGYWLTVEDQVEIAGITITGGMFYYGNMRSSGMTALDRCVVNARLPAMKPRKTHLRGQGPYFKDYAAFTDEQRYVYLQWLASSRSDPSLDDAYLYFYIFGLERRIFVDAVQGKVSSSELIGIEQELRRVLDVYPHLSIQTYVAKLLEFITIIRKPDVRLYEQEPQAVLEKDDYNLPLSVKVAFGQAARDKKPVSASWALAWALNDPAISRRTAVSRCTEEFMAIFRKMYQERFKKGMIFSANNTRLNIIDRYNFDYPKSITALPDVSAISRPRNKIQKLVDECTDVLDVYSRYLGKNPEAKGTLDGCILLPIYLWPQHIRDEIDCLSQEAATQIRVMTFGRLFERLQLAGRITRDKITAITAGLEASRIAVEPDIRLTARTPKASDAVALFCPSHVAGVPPSPAEAYPASELMVDLALLVATAGGMVSVAKRKPIEHNIDSRHELAPHHRERLKARIAMLIAQPPTLAGVRKRLDLLSPVEKDALVVLLVQTANADGAVRHEAVSILEKIYPMLGREPQLLYSDLHGRPAASSWSASAPAAPNGRIATELSPFSLDSSQIEALQKETAKVSALLAEVFAEAESEPATHPEPPAPEPPASAPSTADLLGLDEAHAAFLQLLLTRPTWTRRELADAASDLALMIDGALEQINEASLDHWDETLAEGDDPVAINQELAQRLAA